MRKALFAIASFTLFVSSAFAAKPVLAVAEFRNDTSASWWTSDVGNDLAGMLSNELAATEKFKLVERHKLGAVLDEQDLASSGRVKKSTGAKLGQLTGAQYVVVATVSAFDSKTRETGGGLSFTASASAESRKRHTSPSICAWSTRPPARLSSRAPSKRVPPAAASA
jgi:curli biogenesis system outer membrane secretion channel CsgG